MRLMEYASDGAQVILALREFVLGSMVEAYLEVCLSILALWCWFDCHLLSTMTQFLNLPSVSLIDLLSVDRPHFRFLCHPSRCCLLRGPGFLQRYVCLVDYDSSFVDSGVRHSVLDGLSLVDVFGTVF